MALVAGTISSATSLDYHMCTQGLTIFVYKRTGFTNNKLFLPYRASIF